MTRENQAQFYWQYEYDVTAKYMIPLLEQWGDPLKVASVIDVGCGEGGGLCAMFDAGATCCGFDLEPGRVEAAKQLKGKRAIHLTTGNLYGSKLPYNEHQYDIVVLHDVFEHLERKQEVLEKLKRYMKPEGRLMITFPPYYSAYGAHQQLLNTPWVKIPFFHLLPFALTKILPRLKNETKWIVEEVQKLGVLKMGMHKFEQIIDRGAMKLVGKQAYIISPNHIRFGLKPIPAGPIAEIPILGEVACTGVVYLLAKT
ncbi:MAG: methyltransferase 11 protein [Bacteroidetes bacterium]|nr:methyltransferase 11 protein [Bacteroidota bacterium]